MHPEYKLPQARPNGDIAAQVADTEGVDAAGAESTGSDVASVEASGKANAAVAVHLWEWDGEETLHPFWAVGRTTVQELHKKNWLGSRGQSEFNMGLVDKEFSVVTVGSVKGASVAKTTFVTVPMLVNTKDVKQGTELIMEITPVEAGSKRKAASWKDDAKSQKKPGGAVTATAQQPPQQARDLRPQFPRGAGSLEI